MIPRLLIILLAAFSHAASAAPPKVLSSVPANGDQAVSVALTNIVIEFDQDMNQGGFSVTGGGPSFPKVTGKPSWQSPRRFVMPVELMPGHGYQFGVNSPSARNFKNAAGESAEPVVFRFRTKGGVQPAAAIDPAAAVETLRKTIGDHYSYRDRVVKDWDALFAASGPALKAARTPDAFAAEVARFLKPANDPHLTVRVGDQLIPTTDFKLLPNGDGQKLEKAVPAWRRVNTVLVTGRFEDGIGYLLIPTWQGADAEFQAVHQALDSMKDARALILDMRFNSGGDERTAIRVAARFASRPKVFAKQRVRDPASPDGWTAVHERTLTPDPDPERRFKGRVAVLMGARCFSSNESFLLMMRAAGARLIGGKSYGSSANPKPHDLGGGVALLVPSWEAQDADGRPFEGVGIAPDEHVAFDPKAPGDSVLAAALAWLRK